MAVVELGIQPSQLRSILPSIAFLLIVYFISGSPKFIRADQMCNAQYDCFDGSDECNPACQKENIIDGPILKIAAVIIGRFTIKLYNYKGLWTNFKISKYIRRL